MIIGVDKDKKFITAIVITTAALFLFSNVLLKENLFFSLAIACIPLPVYCIYDKLCVLRNIRKYRWSGSELYIRAAINLVIMDLVLAFCVFQFSKGCVICTLIAAFLYTLTDLLLLLSKRRSEKLDIM